MTAARVQLAPYPSLTGAEPCRQPDADPEWWFTADGETTARAACLRCPRRTACLAWALDHPDDTKHGIWAATDPDRRATLRREFTPTTQENT